MDFIKSIRQTVIVGAVVASLATFSLGPDKAAAGEDPHVKRIYGTIVSVDLTTNLLTFLRRNGKTVVVDISQAAVLNQLGALPLNTGVVLRGIRGPDKVFHVQSIGHAAPRAVEWGSDNDT